MLPPDVISFLELLLSRSLLGDRFFKIPDGGGKGTAAVVKGRPVDPFYFKGLSAACLDGYLRAVVSIPSSPSLFLVVIIPAFPSRGAL